MRRSSTGRSGTSAFALEVALVERLERMLEDDGVAGAARRRSDRVLHHVEQLPDGNGGRSTEIGALVAARVRHDQVILGRQQRVEQELTILAARITVADPLVARREVVAVALDVAGEAPVVQPEQAHHPVRDGAHGHQRADGHVARPEIRPRGPAPESLREQRADVVATEGHGAGRIVLGGLADQLVEQRRELGPLPGVRRRRGRERIGEVRPAWRPTPPPGASR